MVRVIEKPFAPRVQHHALESCAWLYLGRHTRLILSKLRASPLSRVANPQRPPKVCRRVIGLRDRLTAEIDV